jgi:glycosyltransferase involved in cell wall biosynthesis
MLDARDAAEGAVALFCNGELEARHVKALYPRAANNVEVVRLGMDTLGLVGQAAPPGFRETNYVFCAGRLEDRKNQLALLFALKDVGATVVLATGGGTIQPKYAEACRKVERVGKTIFLDRLLPEQFAYVMSHCRVYAQPSWCELPGLATCEAATFKKKIVATCEGGSTTPEYIKENVFWCKPYDLESIRKAAEIAWHEETVVADPFSHINLYMPSHFPSWEGYAHTMAMHYMDAVK